MHGLKCCGAFQIQEISIKWSQPLWPASVSNKRIKVNADKMARCSYGNEPKMKRIIGITCTVVSLEHADRRCVNRAIFVEEQLVRGSFLVGHAVRASPRKSSGSGLNVVEDGGRALSGSMTSPTNRLLRTRWRRQRDRRAAPHLRRRANAPLWPVCDPRCSSDVSEFSSFSLDQGVAQT